MIKNEKIKNLSILAAFAFLLQGCGGGGGGSGSSSSPPSSESPSGEFCQASMSQSSFFEDVSSATSTPVPAEDANYLRARTVKVDLERMKATLLASVQRRIRLDLFDDTPAEVFIEKIEKLSNDNLIVTGHMDDEDSSLSLVINKDVLVANIHPKNGHRYSIRFEGSNGNHSIQEFEDTGEDEDSSCLAVEAPEERIEASVDENVAMAATPIIDMLVAYTPAALSKVGGLNAMKALIQMGIADTNKAFTNSGVGLTARLVGIMALRQNDTNNFSGDLSALKSGSDGRWDEVHAERARLGADQVSVVGVYSGNGVAGIGYIKAAANSAFTITKVGAFNQYSFSHELGHNVGLQHGDGYVNGSGGFRTVMAYGSYPRILRFSNPNLTYNKYTTGTSSQNSASKLNAWGKTTASLVASKVPVSGGGGSVGGGGSQVPPATGSQPSCP